MSKKGPVSKVPSTKELIKDLAEVLLRNAAIQVLLNAGFHITGGVETMDCGGIDLLLHFHAPDEGPHEVTSGKQRQGDA